MNHPSLGSSILGNPHISVEIFHNWWQSVTREFSNLPALASSTETLILALIQRRSLADQGLQIWIDMNSIWIYIYTQYVYVLLRPCYIYIYTPTIALAHLKFIAPVVSLGSKGISTLHGCPQNSATQSLLGGHVQDQASFQYLIVSFQYPNIFCLVSPKTRSVLLGLRHGTRGEHVLLL